LTCRAVSGSFRELVVVEVDLTDGEIIHGAPVGVDLRQLLA